MTEPAKARVVVVVATYRRPGEVARLMASLSQSSTPVHAVVMADNASDPETKTVMETAGGLHHYIASPQNLGCGGGLRLAEEAALQRFPDLTHVWILDDDVVVEPNTLGLLLEAMIAQNAGCACPQVLDDNGRRGWFPGLLDAEKFQLLCNQETPEAFLKKCGPEPIPFSWATGVSLLVTKETLLQSGFHRNDFWIRGEDLDFALRLTQFSKGVYVPTAFVKHLRPGADNPKSFSERMKSAAMLQNCALLFSRTKHGRTLIKHWPGNVLFHTKNAGLMGLLDAMRAFYLGAVRGLAAGASGGNYFQRMLESKR